MVEEITSDRKPQPFQPNLSTYISLTVITVIAAISMRICFAFSTLGKLDSDEAIVLLMAKRLSTGKPVTFFFGQQYGGSQEAFLMAPLVRVFGMHTWIARTIPIFVTSIAFIVLSFGFSYAKGKERFCDPFFWAGLAFVSYPVSFIWWSTRSSGFYPTVMSSGIIAFSIAKTLLDNYVPKHARFRHWVSQHQKYGYILLGVSAGYCWWASPQSVLFLLPLGIWLIVNSWKNTLRKTFYITSGFVIGSFPWVIANLRSGLKSFDTSQFPTSSYFERLKFVFTQGAELLFNLRNWASEYRQSQLTRNLLTTLAIMIFALLATYALKQIIQNKSSIVSLFAIMFVSYPFVTSINPNAGYLEEGRYLWFIVPSICILFFSIPKILNSKIIFTAACLMILSSSLYLTTRSIDADYKRESVHTPARYGRVVEKLESLGISHAAADYWIAYRLVAESNGKIIASPFDAAPRIDEYREEVLNELDAIITKNNTLTAEHVQRFLVAKRIEYKLYNIQNVLIYKLDNTKLSLDQKACIVNYPGFDAAMNELAK